MDAVMNATEEATASVTKETLIGELLQIDQDIAPILFGIGMHCLGCPHATAESLEDACFAHGTNVDELVHQLNEFLAEKQG